MFTVKVQHANGLEELYSAERIHVIHPSHNCSNAASNWDKAGIYLDPETFDEEGIAAREIILFGGDQTDAAKARKGGRVFVMNAQGATVAMYYL